MLNVNTNIYSLSAQRNVNRTQNDMHSSMQRLSSGLRINQAKDDAAGLAVALKMQGQADGYAVAQRNIGDGTSYLNVADSAMRDISDTLSRMRELSVQAQNGTYASGDLAKINEEFKALANEVADVQTRATFNGKAVIGGNADIIVDANGSKINVTGGDAISSLTGNDITTATNAATALTAVSAAMTSVATSLAKVGSFQSRLEFAMSSAMSIEEAQRSAYGRIMDADFAKETARMTSSQIIQQAGISALSQANGMPQMVLGLLR